MVTVRRMGVLSQWWTRDNDNAESRRGNLLLLNNRNSDALQTELLRFSLIAIFFVVVVFKYIY